MPGATVVPLGGLDGRQRAALLDALSAGAVIGVPTDTVYGVAARWDSPSGVGRLSMAKGRDADRPMAVLFPAVAAVEAALPDLDGVSLRVLSALLPGPFTFVVRTAVVRPPLVGTVDSLGVRVPDHAELLEFLVSVGTPLVATSANLSGGLEARLPSEVDASVLAHCSIAFSCSQSLSQAESVAASTVIDLRPLTSGGAPVVLREGAVNGAEVQERIRAVL
jgi:L-threonylcarbamoyladenylate synthase